MNAISPQSLLDLLVDTVCVVDANGNFLYVSASGERLFGYAPNELIGRNMIELVHPEDQDRTLQTVGRIMDGQPQLHFENRYVRKDGRVVHIMWSARWSEPDGVRLAVARDVTEPKRAARLKTALYEISEAAHAAEEPQDVYRHIHRVMSDLLPADDFFLALHDSARDTLSFPYSVGDGGAETEPLPVGAAPLLAEVVRSGRSVLAHAEERFRSEGRRYSGHADGADWLGVPLISRSRVMGALVVRSTRPGIGYTEDDRNLLQFVSSQIATVIERKQSESLLRHMARHDALTDLPNRTLFRERLEAALDQACREREHLAVLYLDLNGFKVVNDTYGHEVGDRLLRQIAQRLTACVRASDTLGRRGGDEFTVLLTNIREPHSIAAIARKIRMSIAEPFEVDGLLLMVSASIGTAVFPEDGSDAERLLRHADAGMYAAKRRARQA